LKKYVLKVSSSLLYGGRYELVEVIIKENYNGQEKERRFHRFFD